LDLFEVSLLIYFTTTDSNSFFAAQNLWILSNHFFNFENFAAISNLETKHSEFFPTKPKQVQQSFF
jgi:hypothetical protein